MKKIFIVAFMLANGFVFAQGGAKIVFKDKDNTIDYGTVSKDSDDGIRKFEFTNTGDQPLVIKNVQSTCGCTVPSKPTGEIFDQMRLGFNPNGDKSMNSVIIIAKF